MKFLLTLLVLCNLSIAQTQYPKDYFGSPLDIPLQLSGNFGELRPNHFHAGFDFKTLQKEGLNVYAVAGGYVSRIKISTFGNGKAIYITHPNGFTSVYGHLQKGAAAIEEYIQKTHYAEQSFEIEMYLKPNELVVKKGDVIAFSGNTGSSEGPHLHFEIRDTQSEKIINPLFFGFDKTIVDSRKPIVSAVYVYPLDATTMVNQSMRQIPLTITLQKDGTYLADKVRANGKIGFGIIANDYDDVSFNKNGIYKVQSFYNGLPSFGYEFNTYSFDEMRFVNALIDYPFYKKTQQRIQKLYCKTPFGLSIIKADQNNGIITVLPNLMSVYRIEVSDYFGNTIVITIPIEYELLSAIIEKETIVSDYFVKASKDNMFAKGDWSVFFPAGTFYDDFDLNFDVKNNQLLLHDDTVPAHTNFTISVTNSIYTAAQREKGFIGRVEGKNISYNPTYLKDNVWTTKVKTLGKYALVLDTIAPKITIKKPIEGKWITEQKTVELIITDDLSGIKSYNGYLNGNWILMEYDNKTKKITYYFNDGKVSEGGNDLKVVVVDNVGNSTIFETHFFRSQILK